MNYSKLKANSNPVQGTIFKCVIFTVFVFLQVGQTALDQARDHNNPEVALLLTKALQVQTV